MLPVTSDTVALERFRALVENASDVIYWTDENGCLTFVNPMGTRLLRYSEQRLLGTYFADLVEPTHRAAARLFYKRQRRERLPQTYYEFPAVSACGDVLWLGQNVRTMFDESGAIVGFEAVARDITARHALERERDRLLAELQETLASAKVLSGLLPICAACKMVREGEGHWTQIESYIRAHTNAEFTHGLCPDCLARYDAASDNC